MSKLRDTSIGLGGTPAATSKYGPTPRPAWGSAMGTTPRDSGQMANGVTGGNYDAASMDRLPNGPGPRGTADVSDQLAEQFQNPGDSST